MALVPLDESKSISSGYKNETGDNVFHANASYSNRSISVGFDMFNPEYCAEHKEDVQSSIKAFIGRLNVVLEENNLPIIQA